MRRNIFLKSIYILLFTLCNLLKAYFRNNFPPLFTTSLERCTAIYIAHKEEIRSMNLTFFP